MFPNRQTFFVLGLSRSGKAAAEFLLERKARVYIYDDIAGAGVEKTVKELEQAGAIPVLREDLSTMHEKCDALVLSPGIPIDHAVAVAFKRNKKAVIGETELAVRYMRCPIVAVTGTNGKTTTVSMIAHILNGSGKKAYCCGNIGVPMVGFTHLTEQEFAVAEISSFQLETLYSICPHVSVVLNLTEDHLNRHYNMENYIFLKSRLLKNATETEFAVLNYDDPLVRNFAEKTKAKIYYFSAREKVNGGYLEDGYICMDGEKILSVGDLLTDGKHNVLNALAAVTACKLIGVESEEIARSLSSFKGIKHRIEQIGEADGIKYVDDSKGTNVDATIKAVECMKEETVLLLGGKDKGYDYGKLFSFLKTSKVRLAVLYGENRFILTESALKNGYKSILLCPDFSVAVPLAKMVAKKGETVLLSPASASFDEFVSYEERGDKFVSFVRGFEEEAKYKEREENAFTSDERKVQSDDEEA